MFEARFRRVARHVFGTSDVTQECAVQLLNELKKHQAPDVSNDQSASELRTNGAWLAKIAFGNAARLQKRERAKKRSVLKEETLIENDLSADNPSPVRIAEARELTVQLLKALEDLEGIEREIIRRHYQEQQSLNLIASELGLCRKRVQRTHGKIISYLRTRLDSRTQDSLDAEIQLDTNR